MRKNLNPISLEAGRSPLTPISRGRLEPLARKSNCFLVFASFLVFLSGLYSSLSFFSSFVLSLFLSFFLIVCLSIFFLSFSSFLVFLYRLHFVLSCLRFFLVCLYRLSIVPSILRSFTFVASASLPPTHPSLRRSTSAHPPDLWSTPPVHPSRAPPHPTSGEALTKKTGWGAPNGSSHLAQLSHIVEL